VFRLVFRYEWIPDGRMLEWHVCGGRIFKFGIRNLEWSNFHRWFISIEKSAADSVVGDQKVCRSVVIFNLSSGKLFENTNDGT